LIDRWENGQTDRQTETDVKDRQAADRETERQERQTDRWIKDRVTSKTACDSNVYS